MPPARVGPTLLALLGAACGGGHAAAKTSSLSASADPAGLVAAADSAASARKDREASARYLAVLALWPDSLPVAERALGSFWRAARYQDAYVWGRRALERDPHSLRVLFDVGVTCGFLVALECADSVFRRTIALDPSFVDGYSELAFLAQARGDLAGAVREMQSAYAAGPENDFAVSGLAQMLIPAREPGRARVLMEPRLALDRKARAYGGRSMLTLYGWALLQLGDTLGADRAFDEVLGWLRRREQAGQTTYQLFRERAAIHALRGEREAAVDAMQTAFERGWRLYGSWSLTDPMFAGVASDPRVAALIEKMRVEVREIRRQLGMESGAQH